MPSIRMSSEPSPVLHSSWFGTSEGSSRRSASSRTDRGPAVLSACHSTMTQGKSCSTVERSMSVRSPDTSELSMGVRSRASMERSIPSGNAVVSRTVPCTSMVTRAAWNVNTSWSSVHETDACRPVWTINGRGVSFGSEPVRVTGPCGMSAGWCATLPNGSGSSGVSSGVVVAESGAPRSCGFRKVGPVRS